VNKNVILLSFYLIHEVIMIRDNISLCFKGLLNLLALYQAIYNSLKALLALNHRFHNYLLILPMILCDVVQQCF